ncbi:hypothetical protein ACF09I_34450 [Streptomyces sp. NPDC014940]|uniref:hypothetical protein n=1 Tax=Streptomyces sp. NPDC014940 TaxID=3364932 RepID=UPI00370085A5
MNQPDPAALLRDAENYLSALHGSVARHDNLAANLGCAGCELRDKLAAELRRLAGEAQQDEAVVDRAAVNRALVALRAGNYISAMLLLESAMNPADAVQPPADDDARRAARRDSLRILLTRAAAGLTPDEDALLRQHTEAEIREADTARRNAKLADAVTAETKRLLERRTTTLRERAERAEAERDRLKAAILDIDAHATPIGLADPNDPDGNPHHYVVTVGALHRSLGKVGHTAAPCTAEAALERVRTLRDPIAQALEDADYRPDMRRGDLADSIMPVILAALDGTEQPKESTTP